MDKLVVKTAKARSELVDALGRYQPWRALPVRQVYIPKSNGKLPASRHSHHIRPCHAGGGRKRRSSPSGRLTFEPCSYGFRPGRGCHDAIGQVYNYALPTGRKKWVVDADIEGALTISDTTPSSANSGSFPARELVRQWLKAGYMEDGVLHDTEMGTPGGRHQPVARQHCLPTGWKRPWVSDTTTAARTSRAAEWCAMRTTS